MVSGTVIITGSQAWSSRAETAIETPAGGKFSASITTWKALRRAKADHGSHLKSPDAARPPGRRQIPTIVSADDPRSGLSWRGGALAKFLGAPRIHSRPPCMGGYLKRLPQRLGQL